MRPAATSSMSASFDLLRFGPGKHVRSASSWKTQPKADASLTKVVALRLSVSSLFVMRPAIDDGMRNVESPRDGIESDSSARTRRQT